MVKARILLLLACVALIVALFMLPKVVVENDTTTATAPGNSTPSVAHADAPAEVRKAIGSIRGQMAGSSQIEKNAIFADSLASLYRRASRFDSAGWFAEEASKFFNTDDSWTQAGDDYYEAYTFATDPEKQQRMAAKAQACFTRVLEKNPKNLEVKTKLAMTHLSSENPMQGIMLLREVLAEDPKNEMALYSMGMLSVQSGQYEKAIERLEDLVEVNPAHTQGHLLLGIAWMNTGEKAKARTQFEKVKQLEKDPEVQATADSYLKDLK